MYILHMKILTSFSGVRALVSKPEARFGGEIPAVSQLSSFESESGFFQIWLQISKEIFDI